MSSVQIPNLLNWISCDVAIDLGTANTLIIHNDKVVVDEPSIVAKNVRTGEVTGPSFEDDRPFFVSTIETNFQATVIS